MAGGTAVKNIGVTGDPNLNGLLYGKAWDGTITYAFPDEVSDYSYTYETSDNFAPVTMLMKLAALFAFRQVSSVIDTTIALGQDSTATIRLGQSDAPATAYAYMPGSYAQAGDLWFGRNYDYTQAQAGNYAWHTVLHEIGHALGLKHGHEAQNGFSALPTAYDSLEYTIMTYRSYVGDDVGPYTYGSTDAPQTFMMGDIAALQHMYGADYSTHDTDTVYSWIGGDTWLNGALWIDAVGSEVFATIWDGGGIDTYDFSAYANGMVVDLAPGASSVFTERANLGSGNYASGNVYNALLYQGDIRSLIENAIGGSGNDTLIGNQASNELSGKNGADTLFGGIGDDLLRGNKGADVMTGGDGADTFVFTKGTSTGVLEIIEDFESGDIILFEGNVSISWVINNATQPNSHTVLSWSDGTIRLKNFDIENLDASDFMLA